MFANFDMITMLISMFVSMLLGITIAFTYAYKNEYKKDFVIQLAILPTIVMAVIAIVNGNVGTGIAVMGAFSLVRFRSIPGNAKEIVFIFFAMSVGLATGMDFIAYAIVFTFVLSAEYLLISNIKIKDKALNKRVLKITIPESLDYYGIFEDTFNEFTSKNKLVRVRTTNMGTLYQLTYEIVFKEKNKEKEFIDQIRIRNGNLDVICGFQTDNNEIL